MRRIFTSPAIAFALATLALPGIAAAEEEGEGAYVGKVTNEAAAKECSACHMAYQPIFLPQRSWKAIMGNLSDHFGEDASLDDKTRQEIEDYLVTNAGDADNPDTSPVTDKNPAVLRITELDWFNRIHGRRARSYAESHSNIGTISNCSGCHRGAQSGFFEGD